MSRKKHNSAHNPHQSDSNCLGGLEPEGLVSPAAGNWKVIELDLKCFNKSLHHQLVVPFEGAGILSV